MPTAPCPGNPTPSDDEGPKARAAWVARVPLPTPDAAVVFDHDQVVVIADPRVSDEQVERLQQAAQLLAELVPEQRSRWANGQGPR